MTNISDARNLLDKSKDGNIYFSKFINNNPASMEYRLYSYSFIEENTFLELSCVNKATTNTSLDGLVKAIQTNSEINIYRVFKNEDGYSYYNLINTFFGGMNTDSDVSMLPNNQYRFGQDVRIITDDSGTSGVL